MWYRFERQLTEQVESKQKYKPGTEPAMVTRVMGYADHVIHVQATKTTHVLEFKMKSSRSKAWQMQIEQALHQLLLYTPMLKNGFEQWLGSIVVFEDSPTSVEMMTKPLTKDQITAACDELVRIRKQNPNAKTRLASLFSPVLAPLMAKILPEPSVGSAAEASPAASSSS